ncbi:enoyl ACP reductase FabMG family protein [Chromobacterium amazonense]|uniref:enoyl ACP reductase FabMG family protein n=1 Tax=Chromobacterium amazonense TaxID=1382803 RepID=UPI003F794528
MTEATALRTLPQHTLFRPGDVFVLFGELFGRGYANGLINEARKAGMEIIGMTVGRRDENNQLRALNEEELAEAEANLGGKIINVPLMAGFDQDAPEGEATPTQLLAALSLKTWQDDKLDWEHIEKCRQIGVARFQAGVAQAMAQLDGMIADGRNVFFAHTMAGGIPKAKVFLAIANRVYKGRGERFLSTEALLGSDLGKLILQNFDEVTANTFQHLIDGSAKLRQRLESSGGQVRYTAYGYHGTEILINGEYQWQTYTNYTQGYAKMRLENIARAAWQNGVKATVFNCPEIRTNSSDIFVGVELPLLALLRALKREQAGAWADAQWQACAALLQDGCALEDVLGKLDALNDGEVMRGFRDFAAWPMPNSPELADVMIGASESIVAMHRDPKALITDHLSSLVIEASGALMFGEAAQPAAPVLWLNHDIIARQLNRAHG